MRFHVLILLISIFIFSCNNSDNKQLVPGIIPQPNSMEFTDDGVFKASKVAVFYNTDEEYKLALTLCSYLDEHKIEYKLLEPGNAYRGQSIKLSIIRKQRLAEEAYKIEVNSDFIKLEASSESGLFYAIQSLRQILIQQPKGHIKIPSMSIQDSPQFGWRGMHLDVSRHFFDVEFVKKYIDYMALFKMNVFHWHLVDDQGWRIEIKKYPKLTETGAWRDSTIIGHHRDLPYEFDYTRYGGYYTQEEIQEVIEYASERYIKVVPEIEIPGHSLASITAYPELGVTGEAPGVWYRWGISPYIYNVEESTFSFLEDVLLEVIELFPSDIIHIGGDEAIKDQWIESERVQERIKELGLNDEHEMQSYFIKRMADFVESHGKTIIGWDEILEGGLAENAMVMSWRGIQGGIDAAKMGNKVVMTPTSHCYFDYFQADKETESLGVGGIITVEKVYNFNPIPDELTQKQREIVLGGQANVWTEFLKTPADVEYMIFPRFIALSESVWTENQNKNYEDFLIRLRNFEPYFKEQEINYAPHVFVK